MTSAMPQLSIKVESWMRAPDMCIASRRISRKPMRMTAAFVLLPSPIPSINPAPTATTFLSAPQNSTPMTSLTQLTRKYGVLNRDRHTIASSGSEQPIVVSQYFSSAISLAMFAPLSEAT
ncbi:hypothetical protein J3B02_001324, partial [Coemansia erecta]